MSKPIKRAKELVQLSIDHHHGLLLAWKIKTGLSKNVAPERIKNYIDWFYENHLNPHFVLEEKYIFPLLDSSNEHAQTAIQQHKQIRQIIQKETVDSNDLAALQEILNEHIRFEERILFNEIQSLGLLSKIEALEEVMHEEKFVDNESDPFWK